MSLVIAVYVKEGIVLASDSRLSLDTTEIKGPNTTVNLSVGLSDASYKTFVTRSGVGITTYGAADINGVPLAGFIEALLLDKLAVGSESPEQVADSVLNFFTALPAVPEAYFFVGGYLKTTGSSPEQQVWKLDLPACKKKRVNKADKQGATWGGETDVLSRLLRPVGEQDAQGKFNALPDVNIPWSFFTLQDAIDFVLHAIRTTTAMMRFQNRPKTVGGPVDVLVVKPDGAFWIQRKRLHGEEGPTRESTVP